MKQWKVIEFLVVEGETFINIHKRLQTVYKSETLDYSNVSRWVQRLIKNFENSKKLRNAIVRDMPCSGRLPNSVNQAYETKADTLVGTDRYITRNELAAELRVSHSSAYNIVDFPVFQKCVPAGSRDS